MCDYVLALADEDCQEKPSRYVEVFSATKLRCNYLGETDQQLCRRCL
jgi:hypothetical protein